MSREIKFRGKILGGNDWVYGCYHFSKDHKYNYIVNREKYLERGNEMSLHYEEVNIVNENTVGQLIWVNEKGNEFYSGDIIHQYNHDADVHSEGELVFCDLGMRWELKDSGIPFYKYHKPTVIGNVHQNQLK